MQLHYPQLDALLEREYDTMVATAYAIVHDRDRALDIAQHASERLVRNWEQVSAYESQGGWLLRVVVNLAVDETRRVNRSKRLLRKIRQQRAVERAPQTSDPKFWTAVQSLSDRQRQVIALFYVADQSLDQVADTLGVSPGTVKSHLSRARETLRSLLEESAL